MASIYSASFVSTANVTGELGLEVPAGYVWVLKDCMVWDTVAGGGGQMYLVGSNGQIFWAFESTAGQAGRLGQWTGRVVLQAGQTFDVLVGAHGFDTTICGYQLTA